MIKHYVTRATYDNIAAGVALGKVDDVTKNRLLAKHNTEYPKTVGPAAEELRQRGLDADARHLRYLARAQKLGDVNVKAVAGAGRRDMLWSKDAIDATAELLASQRRYTPTSAMCSLYNISGNHNALSFLRAERQRIDEARGAPLIVITQGCADRCARGRIFYFWPPEAVNPCYSEPPKV